MAKRKIDNGDGAVREKAKCPISLSTFRARAKPLEVGVDSRAVIAKVREFTTGSFGWFASDKVELMVDGVPVRCQVGVTITIIGSKDADA